MGIILLEHGEHWVPHRVPATVCSSDPNTTLNASHATIISKKTYLNKNGVRLKKTVKKLKQAEQSEALGPFHKTPIPMQSPWRQRAGLPWTSSVWSISAEVPKGNLSIHQPTRDAPR